MDTFNIDVTRVEELQMTESRHELEQLFARAKSTIVNGEKVVLMRSSSSGAVQPFDEITTLEDLEAYRARVFLYL